MSFETNNSNGTTKEERKYQDRNKSDDLQISRTDMNMLIMNYLVTGNVFLSIPHTRNLLHTVPLILPVLGTNTECI